MSKIITQLSLVLLLTATSLTTHAGDREDLQRTLSSFLANVDDRATHDRFWADDLIYTSSAGERRGKAEILAGFEGGAAPARYSTQYGAEDVTIRLLGDVAVLTFRLTADENGARVAEYFNSGVFRRTDSGWRAFTWQATLIPDTPSP